MQLRSWGFAACLLVSSMSSAWAQEGAAGDDDAGDGDRIGTASLRFYADDDHMTVVSPRAGVQAPINQDWTVDVNAAADIVSGASIDVVSEASPVAISETRVEGGVGVVAGLSRLWTTRLRASASHEEDYLSLGGELGTTVELAQRNTVLDVSLVGRRDRVGAVTRPELSEIRTSGTAEVTLTQLLDRGTAVDLTGAAMRDAGYLENPYRTVPVVDPASPLVMRVEERVPGRRWAGAGRVRVRRVLSRTLFARAWYRYYRDDWSVTSHTATAALFAAPGPRWRVGAQLRGYRQSAASFYRERYQLEAGEVPVLRTRERRLGPMLSGHVSVTGDVALRADRPQGTRLVLSLGALRYRWSEFADQRSRNATTLTLGITAPL